MAQQQPDTDRVLQRVILPRDSDPLDVRPLYVDEPEGTHSHVAGRRDVVVPASARVSFASFFNAFPASYWKRWTRVQDVTLRMNVRGAGRVEVYRSKLNGDIAHVTGERVQDTGWRTLEFRVSLAAFEDGGWIWFDVFTENDTLEVADAAWLADEPLPPQKVAVGITTFNRLDDCVASLIALGEDPAVLDVISKVFVADQGTRKIREHERFAEAREVLGERLEVIEQGNLGGSGGFTRALYESIDHTQPGFVDQILLLDDDIALEPDSILRSNAFARAAKKPVIVGSMMLNLQARSRLHTNAEVVDLASFVWRRPPGAVWDHDFAHALAARHPRAAPPRRRHLQRLVDVPVPA